MIDDGYPITGEEACKFFGHENKVFVRRAAKAGIRNRIPMREGDHFFIGGSEVYRYLLPGLILLTSNIIWGNKTAVFVWSGPYHAIVIDNGRVAESNISTFRYLWDIAKEPGESDMGEKTLSA